MQAREAKSNLANTNNNNNNNNNNNPIGNAPNASFTDPKGRIISSLNFQKYLCVRSDLKKNEVKV